VTWRPKLTACVGLIFLFTFYPLSAHCQPITVNMPEWLAFVKSCSEKYGVDPYFALAVAETESSCKGKRFRFGRLGKGTYYGPFGIHRCFIRRWNIADLYINTEVGIRSLARYKSQRRTLKKYNASFNEVYYRRIKFLEARNRREQVFCKSDW
jgi:hypothetical protein